MQVWATMAVVGNVAVVDHDTWRHQVGDLRCTCRLVPLPITWQRPCCPQMPADDHWSLQWPSWKSTPAGDPWQSATPPNAFCHPGQHPRHLPTPTDNHWSLLTSTYPLIVRPKPAFLCAKAPDLWRALTSLAKKQNFFFFFCRLVSGAVEQFHASFLDQIQCEVGLTCCAKKGKRLNRFFVLNNEIRDRCKQVRVNNIW